MSRINASNLSQSQQLSQSQLLQQQQSQQNRPKIFGEWPKQNLKFNQNVQQQVRRSDKRNQSLRAEQTLQRSLMLITNIKNYLIQKKYIEEKYNQYMRVSAGIKKQLESITTQSGKPYNSQEHRNLLKKFNFHIRNQSKFLRESQTFILANLANYDTRVSSPKFTRSYQQSHRDLQQILRQIQSKRINLQQNLTSYQQNIPKSEIVPEISNNMSTPFEYSLQNLQKSIQDDKLIQIHLLMLYQINHFEQNHRNFYIQIQNNHQNYTIHEAIYDSLKLMKTQKQQMNKDRKIYQKSFDNLNMSTAQQIIKNNNDAIHILAKNQKIYNTNTQLLARYNAQTNLTQYANRRKQYIQELQKYKSKLNKWKQQQNISSFLYQKQQILDRYIKRIQLGDNNITQKQQRQSIKHVYYDCLNCQVPQKYDTLRRYRLELINNIGNVLEKQGIVMPQRNQLLASQKLGSSVMQHKEQLKFHRYLNFFIELEKISNKDKVAYLVANKDKIRALKYQLTTQYGDNNSIASQNYKIDLDYCQAIIEHQEKFDGHAYLKRVDKNREYKWTGLPLGLDSLLYFYTNDVIIQNQITSYITSTLTPKLTQISQKISQKIQSTGLQKRESSQKQQYPYEYFNTMFTVQQRRYYFITLYRKISQYSSKIKEICWNYYWNVIEKCVIQPYIDFGANQKRVQVLKKEFFTFRVLAYLKIQGSKLKLSNFTQLVEYYLDQLQKYSLYKWTQTDLFLQIIKQKIFLKFLTQKKLQNNLDISSQITVLQYVNQAIQLLYESNDHVLLCRSDNIQDNFQHGLKLYRAWEQLKGKIVTCSRIDLQEKARAFVSSIYRPPINISSNASLPEIQAVLNLPSKLQKLKKVSNLPSDIKFLAATYIRCHHLLKITQNLSYPYTHSDILIIRDNIDKTIYLEQLKQYCRKQLLSTNAKTLLIQIISIYKGKKIGEIQKELLKSRYNVEIQGVLGVILGKLETMVRRM